jgi:hypothetical protein
MLQYHWNASLREGSVRQSLHAQGLALLSLTFWLCCSCSTLVTLFTSFLISIPHPSSFSTFLVVFQLHTLPSANSNLGDRHYGGSFRFFSGEFISGINVILDIVDAINEQTGSSAEYQNHILQLKTVRSSGLDGAEVGISNESKTEIQQAVWFCEKTITDFLAKCHKYEKSLGSKGQPDKGLQWLKRYLREVQRIKYTKDDLAAFHRDIQIFSPMMLLAAIAHQVHHTTLSVKVLALMVLHL